MADSAVHSFTAKVNLADTDEFYLVQDPYAAGDDRRVALSDLRNNFGKNTMAAGVLTASAPMALSQTWNGVGVVFTGRRASFTDTASHAQSVLDELLVGGATKYRVLKTGHIQGPDVGNQGSFIFMSGGYVQFGRQDVSLDEPRTAAGVDGFYTVSGGVFAWNANSTSPVGGAGDETRMERDAAGVIAFKPRNGVALPHSLRIYREITNALNYQRQAFQHGADYFEWAAETLGSGADNINLRLTPAGTGLVTVSGVLSMGNVAGNTILDSSQTTVLKGLAGTFYLQAHSDGAISGASNYIKSVDSGNLTFATANTDRWAIDATSGSWVVASGTPNIGDASGFSPVNIFAASRYGFVGGPTISFGSGSPEGAVTASPGSIYMNTAGGTDTALWTKGSGSGNTGWVAVDNV